MRKITVLILIQLFISSNLFSQYYFYVSTSNEKLKPASNEKAVSNDKTLNQLFKEFEVTSYRQSFPGAKNPELQSFYEIHFNDSKNKDLFESALKKSKAFDKIYRCDYYKPASCGSPVAINDAEIINNRINNDALDLLDARCAWTITRGDPNITVAVVDTEFDTNHEDMRNTFAGVVGTQEYFEDHGTSVASCVATETNNSKGIAGIGYNTSRVRKILLF